MNTTFRALLLCALAAFLCSCASSSVKKTWKAPDFKSPRGKTAVLALADRGLVRQSFENRFVAALAKAGVPAAVTFEQLTAEEAKLDKRAAADRFRAMGAEAVLLVRPVDQATSYRQIQPGGESYRGTITGFESYGWYECYSVGFASWSPTYGSLKQTLYLETALFDLNTEKRLWSGLTKTVVKENMDKVPVMDQLVARIVGAMQKDGVIR